jgi:thiopeptide-type bacteriocin biosynthesis protein
MKEEWFAFYLFVNILTDDLITSWLAPLIAHINQVLLRRSESFFIRYSEGGPHVRVRIYITESEKETVRAAIETYTDEFKARSQTGQIDKLVYCDYLPEVKRYGDERTIYWAEMQFVASSEIVMAWLAENSNPANANHFIIAIRLHLSMFFAMELSKEDSMLISEHFMNAWLPVLYNSIGDINKQHDYFLKVFDHACNSYQHALLTGMADFWKDLGDGKGAHALLSYIKTNASVALAYNNAHLEKGRIINAYTSFMHMTHNRLGIKNQDEAFIAFLLKKCILYIYA